MDSMRAWLPVKKVLIVALVCIATALLFFHMDRIRPLEDNVIPGFWVSMLLDGSLHDHVMRGYTAVALIVDCALYSGIALLIIRLGNRKPKSY
jgi:hypothetical protein